MVGWSTKLGRWIGVSGRGRYGPASTRFKPKPVEVDGEYEVDVVDMSRRGDAGVAKIMGFVIFIPNTRPGQHVKVKITKVGRNYAVGQVVE